LRGIEGGIELGSEFWSKDFTFSIGRKIGSIDQDLKNLNFLKT